MMGFFNFRKHILGFEHNLENSDHAACLTWSQCLAMYSLNLRLPVFRVPKEWTIPQLDKVLNWKTILAQLERAS